MTYKIITWNMDWWKRTDEQRKAGWEYLQKQNCDFALLQEVKPDWASMPGCNINFQKLMVKKEWGTAIVSKGYNFIHHSFPSSYDGSPGLLCCEYLLPGDIPIFIINMYGKIDASGFASTTIHHMIADITTLVYYNKQKYILLAGDFNISEQWDEKYKHRYPLHKLCFDQFNDLGFVNITKLKFGGHFQTHVHNNSDFPWQIDYFFLNKKLYTKINDCKVHNQEGMLDLSDHYPVELTLDL